MVMFFVTRWEHLQLILEVYQFARDAAVAEAWLIAQDPYLKSEELGVSTASYKALLPIIFPHWEFIFFARNPSTKWKT